MRLTCHEVWVAHDSLPPNPNHGFLISASKPATTAEVTDESPRLIPVIDEYDALGYGNPQAYLDSELRSVADKKGLQSRRMLFRGLPAVEARYESTSGVVRDLVIYRRSGGLIYDLRLQTTAHNFDSDSALFALVRSGFHVLPIPKGACTNP